MGFFLKGKIHIAVMAEAVIFHFSSVNLLTSRSTVNSHCTLVVGTVGMA